MAQYTVSYCTVYVTILGANVTQSKVVAIPLTTVSIAEYGVYSKAL